MTLIIEKPTGAKVNLAQTYVGIDDPDAAAYITAAETADGQSLETAVKVAIHSFVKGCKNDGIWPAIKASCILAGARTLAGSLVPLVGAAPTNFNFVSGDYERKTGLSGDGSTKYLNSNRNNNADPQNNQHLAVHVTQLPTTVGTLINGGNNGSGASGLSDNGITNRSRNSSGLAGAAGALGFRGVVRSVDAGFTVRGGGVDTPHTQASQVAANAEIRVFNWSGISYSNARIAFYSIGESLNLTQLDTRVSALITAIGAAF